MYTPVMKPGNSVMYVLRNSAVESTVTSPSSVMRPGVNWMYASIAFICGELQKLRMLLRCCWAIAVPIAPGEVPMIADGLRANEFLPHGRLAQSIAFLRTPGMERLYSGVTKRTASTLAIASLSARAGAG